MRGECRRKFQRVDIAGADIETTLIAENAALAELLRDADPDTPVPTCPEWTLDQLMRHVGRGDRWCAQIVAEGEYVDPRTVPGGKPPNDRDGQIAWLHDGPRLLIDAVAQTGPDTPVWTFLGLRPAAWWIRRRLHETAVHRADAALALGTDFEIDPSVKDRFLQGLDDIGITLKQEAAITEFEKKHNIQFSKIHKPTAHGCVWWAELARLRNRLSMSG